jgi:uncharacterized membrane-anchored protein
MRRYLVLLVVVLQIAIMASLVVKREALLSSDKTVVLRTAPVDPRDPFRGDFVILDYEVGSVPSLLMDTLILEERGDVYRRVYASLKTDINGVAQVTKLSVKKPDSGLFLRGSVGGARSWWSDSKTGQVKYGIEKLFVEQGLGLAMEKRVGQRDEWQQPMEVTVGLAGDGTSAIKSWRWSDMAFRLEVKEPGSRQGNQAVEEGVRMSPLLTFSVRNEGEKPLGFYNPGDDCGFQLLSQNNYQQTMLNDECNGIKTSDEDLIVLQAGEIQAWDMDKSSPRWHVKHVDHEGEIGSLDGWLSYRLAYQPPENIGTLSTDALAWGSRVLSPSFFGAGVID